MMDNVLEQAIDISKDTERLITLVGVVAGLLKCFFGYRIFKIIIAICGFAIGAVIGGGAGLAFGGSTEAVLGAVLGGLLLALLAYALYFVCVFLLGAGTGALLSTVALSASGASPHPAVAGVAAVVGGILAVIVQKMIIVISTSFVGAWGVVTGLFALFGRGPSLLAMVRNPEMFGQLLARNQAMVGCWLVLAIVGILVQYGLTARDKAETEEEEKENEGGGEPVDSDDCSAR